MPADFDPGTLVAPTVPFDPHVPEPEPEPEPWVRKPSREPRRHVHLPAAALMEDRSTFTVTVVNLSYDGCRIKTPTVLAPGIALTISVLGLGKMPANVRWYSDGYAGLSFGPGPVEPPPLTPRQDRRVSLNAEFLLRRSGRKNHYACTTDVSPSGCSVEFVDRPSVGERHWVKFDGLDGLEAEVRWVSGFKAGLQFVRPIYPAVFELLVARLR